jgi:hypothetical protein
VTYQIDFIGTGSLAGMGGSTQGQATTTLPETLPPGIPSLPSWGIAVSIGAPPLLAVAALLARRLRSPA